MYRPPAGHHSGGDNGQTASEQGSLMFRADHDGTGAPVAILHIHVGEGMVADLTFDLRTFTNVVEEADDLLLAMRWEVADWAVVACESEEVVHLISTQGTVSPRRRALCGRRPTRDDAWEAEPLDDPEAWDMDALCRACVVRYRMQAVAKVSVLRGGDA